MGTRPVFDQFEQVARPNRLFDGSNLLERDVEVVLREQSLLFFFTATANFLGSVVRTNRTRTGEVLQLSNCSVPRTVKYRPSRAYNAYAAESKRSQPIATASANIIGWPAPNR